ncbi:MAG TPA: CBS domain-containing protein [Terriglobales bacterium]|nr:CBS domain-containing protein [Terriglobales bacterium]
MATIALSELLGTAVLDPEGRRCGRVREIAISPQEHPTRVSGVIVKTDEGERVLPHRLLQGLEKQALRASSPAGEWQAFSGGEGFLLLSRDLLDQQIIDVHGRKVVRVNDVDLLEERHNAHLELKLASVDVGARGAVRRLLKGLVPAGALRALVNKIPPRVIPWEFVDLIETDPARRVKLKIEHELLAKLHPADIADIVEELAPAEREAVFETLDEEVAAEALEEVDPKLQVKILESLDSDRAADIVEAMDPDAAADVLGDLPKETSEEILEEMQPAEREEVAELLEFKEDTAAGRMTTEYLAMGVDATVRDAVETLRQFEGGIETLSTIFLLGPDAKLMGAVPLANIVIASSDTPLQKLALEPLISAHAGANEKAVAELFDKYNLLTLPVVDDEGRMTGVITADDVISLLRSKL